MIRKIGKMLSREMSGLHEAAFLLGLASFASALLAVIRDRLLAHTFGASKELDIYYAAFSVPDLLNVTIASFVAVTVLIPFLVKKMKSENGVAEANRFLSEILTVYTLVMGFVAAIAYAAMPFFERVLVPGFTPAESVIYISFARILLLQPFLLGLSSLFGGVTQSLHKFLMFALSPLLYNLGIIAGVIFFYPIFGVSGLVWGVVFGAFLHMAIQLPAIFEAGFRPFFRLKIRWDEIRNVVVLSLPRSAGLGMTQILTVMLFRLASDMSAGSIALFQFADNLQAVPLGIVGVAYSTAAFPSLARLMSEGKRREFAKHVSLSIRHILYWSLPISAVILVLRNDIVSLLLGTGRFTPADVVVTGTALGIFAFSVAPQGLLLLFTRSYYAAEDTAKPVFANMFSTAVTIALAVVSVYWYETSPMVHSAFNAIFGWLGGQNEVLVLPVAFSIGMILNALLHWEAFVYDFLDSGRELFISFVRSLAMSFATALALYYIRGYIVLYGLSLALGPFFSFLVLTLLSFVLMILFSWIFARSELHEVWAAFGRRFKKANAVAPELPSR